MPRIDSPFWDTASGVCLKHLLLQVPCPQCLAEQDPDVGVKMTISDFDVLAFELGMTVRDLLPKEHAGWMAKRIIN